MGTDKGNSKRMNVVVPNSKIDEKTFLLKKYPEFKDNDIYETMHDNKFNDQINSKINSLEKTNPSAPHWVAHYLDKEYDIRLGGWGDDQLSYDALSKEEIEFILNELWQDIVCDLKLTRLNEEEDDHISASFLNKMRISWDEENQKIQIYDPEIDYIIYQENLYGNINEILRSNGPTGRGSILYRLAGSIGMMIRYFPDMP